MLGNKRKRSGKKAGESSAEIFKKDEATQITESILDTLPHELLQRIADYVSPIDLANLGGTCLKFRGLIFSEVNALHANQGLSALGLSHKDYPYGVTVEQATEEGRANAEKQWSEVQTVRTWDNQENFQWIEGPANNLEDYQRINTLLNDAHIAKIEGVIGSDLSKTYLNLSEQCLTRFPAALFNKNQDYWNALRVLTLANNQLSGEIPELLGSLVSLRWLSLESNQLSGEIPELLKLDWFDLRYNQLSGEIPPALINKFGEAWAQELQYTQSTPARGLKK
jgi:hypothetical protein